MFVSQSFRYRRSRFRGRKINWLRFLCSWRFMLFLFFTCSVSCYAMLRYGRVAAAGKEVPVEIPRVLEKDAFLLDSTDGRERFRTSLRGLSCPPYDPASLDALQIPLKYLPRKKPTSVATKYNRRARNCVSNGLWHRVRAEDHGNILSVIFRIAGLERDSFILDWGSGCGYTMQLLFKEYGVISVGIDVANVTIDYARKLTSSELLHCVADGSNMKWIPSNFFDHVISFGAVLHVYSQVRFCHVLRQMVRVVKPLGTVYNGWSDESDFKREHVHLCLADLPVSYEIIEEKVAFRSVKVFPLKTGQTKPNTYSLVIRKRMSQNPVVNESVYDDLAAVPFFCDGLLKDHCVAVRGSKVND